MATKPQGRRLTEARVVEIHERFAELEARLSQVEERVDAGELLAEEMGQAALRTLQQARRPQPRQKGRQGL